MRIFLGGGGSGKQTIEATRRFSNVIDHTKPLLYELKTSGAFDRIMHYIE